MEIPKCPRHPSSEVVRAGWAGNPGHQRQRWWCRPKRAEAHRFAEAAPRICRHSASEATCEVCATHLEPWEGQPAPRLYGFTAAEVASALAMVASGSSYRSTAEVLRRRAGRVLPSAGPSALDPNRHGQLVSDWVDVFAPVIWGHYAPARWGDYLLLDAKEFRFVPTVKSGQPRPKHRRAFVVQAVVAHDPGRRPVVVAVQAARSKARSAWVPFMRRTSAPSCYVGDRGEPLQAAGIVWPSSTPRRCEWHLRKNLKDALPAAVRTEPHPIHALISHCMDSQAEWDVLVAEVAALRAADPSWANLAGSIQRMDALVRAQVPYGKKPPGPAAIGPVENYLRDLESFIGDRAHALTNRHRTTALLQLHAAKHNGWGSDLDWAKVIREHLERRKGTPVRQRQHVDPLNRPSLRPRTSTIVKKPAPPRPPGSRAKPTT